MQKPLLVPTRLLTIACSMVLLVGACAPSNSEGESDSYTGPLEGKLSNNGLVLDFSMVDLLVTTPMSTDASTVDENGFGPLLATSAGQELFSYLVTCALDEDQDLRAASGAVYSGNLGLAPQWLEGDCDSSCQRWISACVLAHTNEFGQTVQISPRGSHESLSWNQEIENAFNYEEAAYYGNLFSPADERVAIVCSGGSLFSTFLSDESGNSLDAQGELFVNGRTSIAGSESILFAGLCNSGAITGLPSGLGDASACSSREGGYFQGCLLEADEPLEPRYNEVITVFLAL